MSKHAVDAPRRNIFMMNPADVVIVGIDTQDTNKADHYLWDPRIKLPVDQALVNNIRTYGVIKPVVAVKDGDKILIVDGRQRARACRAAWLAAEAAGEEPPRLPVSMVRGTEMHTFGISRAANQFNRAETAMANAENAQRMLDLGATPEQVAVTYGVKPQTIKDWTTLLDLAAPVRKAVDAGEVSPSAAASLAKLSKEEQVQHLEELRAEGAKPTVERVQNQVRGAKGKPALKTPKTRISEAVARMKEMYDENRRSTSAVEVLEEIAKILTDKPLTALLAADKEEAADAA